MISKCSAKHIKYNIKNTGDGNLVIALDPSLSSTGYAIFETNDDCSFTLVQVGTIRTSNTKDCNTDKRLTEIVESLTNLYDEYHKEGRTIITAIEDPIVVQGRLNNTLQLAGLHYLIRHYIEVKYIIPNSEWKRTISVATDNNYARKKEMAQQYLTDASKNIANIIKKNTKLASKRDWIDAIGIGFCVITKRLNQICEY